MIESIAQIGYHYPFISEKDNIGNKTKCEESKTTRIVLATHSFSWGTNSIQEANMALQKLIYIARMAKLAIDEKFSFDSKTVAQATLPEQNTFTWQNLTKIIDSVIGKIPMPNLSSDLEDVIITLVKSMNDILTIVNEASDIGAAQEKTSPINNNGLEQLKELILSALKNPETMHEITIKISMPGIKLVPEGILGMDHQILEEALSVNTIEVARSIKTVTGALIETLPLCIDPNSGALVYTGKRLEDDGNGKAPKVFATFEEELEKEKVKLDKKLDVAETLMAYSYKIINNLKPYATS